MTAVFPFWRYLDGTGDITPLHRATNRPQLVKAMIDRGVKVKVADDSGNTPLHWAALQRSVESVKLLLAAGADSNAKDKADRLFQRGQDERYVFD